MKQTVTRLIGKAARFQLFSSYLVSIQSKIAAEFQHQLACFLAITCTEEAHGKLYLMPAGLHLLSFLKNWISAGSGC